MASAVACKGASLASLLKKLLAEPSASGALCPATLTAARRLFNTQGSEVRCYDDDTSGESGSEYEDADAGGRRRARDFTAPSFFSQGTYASSLLLLRDFFYASFVRTFWGGCLSAFAVLDFADVLDRFGAPTSLGRLLALMEDATSGLSSTASSPRCGWSVAKEDDEAVYLKVAMPGLGKEHVKVWAEQNSVMIKGEGEKEPWDGDDEDAAVPRYSRRIVVPADAFKMDKIKAEMKNGVLRVTVPKVKEEERKDVFQVKIE
ncbi:hypothetical protein ACQ4PT_071312 [Festuca glaucescens]